MGIFRKGVEHWIKKAKKYTHSGKFACMHLKLIFYEKPLQFLGIPGTILFLAGLVLAIILNYQYYMTWPRIFIPIIFFSSIALVLIGILGIFTAACARARRPELYLGVPGALSFLVGIVLGTWMLQIYAAQDRIVANIAFASIAFILIGMFTVSTAITIMREQHRQCMHA